MDGVDEVLQRARAVSLCNYYHATMRHLFYTVDTRDSKYNKSGGTALSVYQVHVGGQAQVRSKCVIGSPLTLIPALYDEFGSSNAQVNALKAQLVDYYERLQACQRGVIAGRYDWKTAWRIIMKDIYAILARAPVLRERTVPNAEGGVDYEPRRHAVFVPMSNVEIEKMRQHSLGDGDEKSAENSKKYFRMCQAGAFNQMLYRVYDSNFHAGLFGNAMQFPEFNGSPGSCDRLGGGRVLLSGQWSASLVNAYLICIKKLMRVVKL